MAALLAELEANPDRAEEILGRVQTEDPDLLEALVERLDPGEEENP